MHPALRKLSQIEHQERTIIGLMSGTSLDGLDIALCKISGADKATKVKIEKFTTIAYSNTFLTQIKEVFANPNAPLQKVNYLHALVAREYASLLKLQLEEWQILAGDIDILASHGQTIFHAPKCIELDDKFASATTQIGDGDHLAYLTGITTLSDFRQKHVAALGEGAPLVPYADYLLFSSSHEDRVLLNVGGIANFSYLPKNSDFNEVVSTDTGPGNTLMDQYLTYANETNIQATLPSYDVGGQLAKAGEVDQVFLQALLHLHSRYTSQSTGQEVLNIDFLKTAWKEAYPKHNLPSTGQALKNILASLNMFTAITIVNAINVLAKNKQLSVYVSGGGAHNAQLMSNLAQHLQNSAIHSFDKLGISADAKEAALFAVLANQCLFGNNDVFENTKGIPAISLGKISLP